MGTEKARGVWPVMLTPFHEDGSVDWEGLDALTDWYVAAGVTGLFAVCLSSEMFELTPEERVRLAQRVVARAAGRVPVVAAGAFGDSMAGQAEAVRRLADTGVNAVVLTVNQLAKDTESDAVWQANAEAMLAACPGIAMGLYECPAPYHRKLSPELLIWAARTGRFRFLKDTCCRLDSIKAKLDVIRGTPMVWYNAHCPSLLESLRLGGQGYSGVAANFYPELLVRLCRESTSRPEAAERLQRFLTLADGTIRHRYPASAKRWLGMLGLPIGETCRVPAPARRADDDETLMLENLQHWVREAGGEGAIVPDASPRTSALRGAGSGRTVARTAKGTPIIHLWECPRPDPAKPGAGYPILEGATHTKIYHATPETGGYSHHAKLTVHNGIFYAMWSNHPKGEDSPGQFVRFSVSRDGKTWSDPRRLFPPYGEIKGFNQVGAHGGAAGWVAVEGRLYGLMGLTDCVGFANSDCSSAQDHEDADHRFMVRKGLGGVARAVDASGDDIALGPILLMPGGKALMASEPLAKEIAPANETLRVTAEALHNAIKARSPAGERTAVDTLRPCEPVYYRAKDGKHVCLLRDEEYSHRMYVSVSDDGKTWPAAQPTDIPDSPSQSDAVVLDDGTVLLIGNQMAPKFDNPDEIKHHGRDPLMVSVSADGYRFTRAYALRTGRQTFRVPQVGGRDGGGQYPSGVVHKGRLHVLYSMGKEDIWISSVALRDLGIGGVPVKASE